MIKLTNIRKNRDNNVVYINPKYIIRVGAAINSSRDTVVEVEGSQYDTWCAESVEQVIQLMDEDLKGK